MNPMTKGNEILTMKDICDLLQVHPTTIYGLVRKGKIPSFRIGTDWRFRRDQIVRWMAEQTEKTKHPRLTLVPVQNRRG